VVNITYFKNVIPKEDYILIIIFDNDCELQFPMSNFISQFRFSPLQNIHVWYEVEVFPTHLEWNKGSFQVTLNIEEAYPNYYKK